MSARPGAGCAVVRSGQRVHTAPGRRGGGGDVLICEGVVGDTCTHGSVAVDADGLLVAPGLVDIHGHGAAGHDFTEPEPTAITAPWREVHGRGSFERHVTTLLTPPRTAGLLLGETLALDGRWSTYPPHRHPPAETELQEAFAFRVRPDTGFGVLLTYDDGVRDAHPTVLTDTFLAAVPGGYHTIAAAAGHDLYYLRAAHGTDTYLALHTDPAHAWLLES